ncbi:hypothetical protein HLB44_29400 [Aquincola sp. S2]|uniref:DUF6701 domain-containing protein n=1 Tax=Pseudaquabacterium terrae TaxID=2732868 RepID=A0ABX2ER08_9BURK|nr:DUF6701 domain-containing protein [Aquabacterium terrae]NRF71120.1 hypothetical protein [Aquabacterium terrae]
MRCLARALRAALLAAVLCAGPARAAISYVGASSVASSSATNTLTVARPAGLAAGDVMLAQVTQRYGNYPLAQNMPGVPAGWSVVIGTDDGNLVGTVVYRKLAGAAEPASYTWTLSRSDQTAIAIVAFRGVDGGNPVNASAARSNGAATAYATPSVTTTSAQTMLVAFYSAVNGNGSVAAATGMTGAFSIGTGAGPNGAVIGASYALQPAAGASGSKVSTGNPSLVNLGLLVAFDPGTVTGPDHYELALPASSINCLPSTVTVTACADNSSPCTSAYAGAAGSSATLATSGATLGATTVTFNAAGVASTTLSYPGAPDPGVVAVTLSGEQLPAVAARRCCPNGASCTTANSCSTTFNSAGFIIAAAAGGAAATIPVQTAGTASAGHVLRAVRSSTTTAACSAALTGAITVNWAYRCSNPALCSGANLMVLNGGSATPIQRNDSGAPIASTAVPMSFDGAGNAPFSFTFADVGQVGLWVSKLVNGATLSGSSNTFVTRPAGFVVDSITQTASPFLANPAAADAGGPRFVRAGERFGARISAVASTGAVTPNYGRESTPEGVLLARALVAPAGGAAGTLSNALVAGASFSNGVAAPSALAWDEVGIITLSAAVADGDYLGAGNVAGPASARIGRFVPDRFSIAPGSVQPACSNAFSYFGQDGFGTDFTLRAENAGGVITLNYSGSFARLDLTSWSPFAFSAAGLPAGALLGAGATAPSGSWSLGQAAVSARHQVGRPPAPSVEAAITISAAPVDSDGVTMAAAPVAPATPLRFGRLRLSNAFGSETSSLSLPVQAQYWSGRSWLPNGADSCTVVPAAAVARSGTLDGKGAPSTAWSTTPGAVSIVAGNGTLLLSAPSPPMTGSVDIALNLGAGTVDQSCLALHPASTGAGLPWLRGQQGSCAPTWDRDPAARASYGIHAPETRRTLHARELF